MAEVTSGTLTIKTSSVIINERAKLRIVRFRLAQRFFLKFVYHPWQNICLVADKITGNRIQDLFVGPFVHSHSMLPSTLDVIQVLTCYLSIGVDTEDMFLPAYLCAD